MPASCMMARAEPSQLLNAGSLSLAFSSSQLHHMAEWGWVGGRSNFMRSDQHLKTRQLTKNDQQLPPIINKWG